MISPSDVAPFNESRAIGRFLLPYFAPVFDRMIPVPVAGAGSHISCDRLYRVFFDPQYARQVGAATFSADLIHEAAHLFLDHHERLMGSEMYDHRLANLATDEAANQFVFAIAAKFPDVVRPGGVRFPAATTGPSGALRVTAEEAALIKQIGWVHPSTYGHPLALTCEEYYSLHKADQQQQQQKSGQQGKSDGDPQQGAGGGSGDADDDGDGDPKGAPQKSASGSGGKPQGGKSKPGAGRGACGSCAGGADELTGMAVEQHGALPDGPNDVEAAAIRQAVAQKAIEHEAQKGRGSVPGGLLRQAQGILAPPKVPWRKQLRSAIRGEVTRRAGMTDYTYGRRSPLQSAVGRVVLPGLAATACDVAIVADTSGSMGNSDLLRIGSEVRSLLRDGLVARCWWVPTDATAAEPKNITTVRQAMDRLLGGGGTDMGAGLDAVDRIKPRVGFTIVITDGDTGWPKTPPKGRVIVVLTRRSSAPLPAWPVTVVHAY